MTFGPAPIRRSSPALLLAGILAGFGTLLATPGVAVALPAYTLDDRATAIASPSLVYLEATFEGYLRTRSTGALVDPTPVVVTRPCTGFVLNSTGYVATAAHCMQPTADSLRDSAVTPVANNLIQNHQLASDQKTAFVQQLKQTADFTGLAAGSAPTEKIYGQLYSGTAGLTKSPAITGTLVDARAAPDVALVKLAAGNLPVVKLSTTDPRVGSHVVQLAFAAVDPNATPVAYAVRSLGAGVIGTYGDKSPTIYMMDGDLGGMAYGGMAVDQNGAVVGVINAGKTSNNRSNELVAAVPVLSDMLNKAGVKNQLSAHDTTYQAALGAYYAGRYSDAVKKLDSVLAAEPGNSVAANLRSQAQQRFKVEGDQGGSGSAGWLTLVLAGVGGIVVAAGTATIIALTRRKSTGRGPATGYAPPSQYPAGDPYRAYQPQNAPVSTGSVSGAPVSGSPVSGSPVSASPVSGSPVSGSPVSVNPVQSAAPATGAGPVGYYGYQPGVPAPVSPPQGMPEHPTWMAPAPTRLPATPQTDPTIAPVHQPPVVPAQPDPAAPAPDAPRPEAG